MVKLKLNQLQYLENGEYKSIPAVGSQGLTEDKVNELINDKISEVGGITEERVKEIAIEEISKTIIDGGTF